MKLKHLSIAACALALSLLTIACSLDTDSPQNQTKFYSADARPATISYSSWFQYPISEIEYEYEDVDSSGKITLYETDQEKITEAMNLEAMHLYGVFTYHTKPNDFFEHPGTIDDFAEPKMTAITQDEDKKFLRIKYDFRHHGVFYKDLFGNRKTITKKFYMPNAPTLIYQAGFPKNPKIDPKTKKPINPCTSHHDNSELAFWYFWSPDRKGCPASFKKSLHFVTAKITQTKMTKRTYPEYEKLYSQNENGIITVNFIIGKDEKFNRRNDLGRKTFDTMNERFKSLIHEDGSRIFEDRDEGSNAKLRQFTYKTDQFDAHINLHFVDPDAETWDYYIADLMVKSDVMIYAGHSAEGYYFDPVRLFEETGRTMPKKKYQVFYMDSCTSWSYFNKNLFDIKSQPRVDPKGTKYLEIVTNAIGAPFLVNEKHDAEMESSRPSNGYFMVMSLLGMNPDGSRVDTLDSWQKIMQRISKNTGYMDTALTNVIGDKDNPTVIHESLRTPSPL